MADWRAVYESWDTIPDENKTLIVKLMRQKPKEKLAELFGREPYAQMVYEKVVGKWQPPLPSPAPNVPQVAAVPQPAIEIVHQKETAEVFERVTPGNWVPAPMENAAAVFLPIISLLSILSAEIAYYKSNLVVFLDNSLPYNLRTWLILLVLALAFGTTGSVYILKIQKQGKTLNEDLRRRPQRENGIVALVKKLFSKIMGRFHQAAYISEEEKTSCHAVLY